MKRPAVYIMANKRKGTLYTGVTSDLGRRVYLHKHGSVEGFAFRYGCRLLVYYEAHDDMMAAIAREKQIKAGSRRKKLALIQRMNPQWRDLYVEFVRRLDTGAEGHVIATASGSEAGSNPPYCCWIASSGCALLAMTR